MMNNLKNKKIITAALTGALTPAGYHIPATPEEISEDAYACWKAGAAVVHLHMRDDQGFGTMDVEKFRETIKLIKRHKDFDGIINCTTSGDAAACNGSPEGDQLRMKHIRELDGIEMASYDSGSFNWMPLQVFMNTPKFLEELGDVFISRNIKPEIEIFDTGQLSVAKYFVEHGHLSTPCHFQLCMGILGGMPASVQNLAFLVEKLPENSTWSAFGIGTSHMPIMFATLALGGNIRVGLEDNVVYGKDENGKRIPATNVMLVERAVRVIKEFGMQVATPKEAREILGIPQLSERNWNSQW